MYFGHNTIIPILIHLEVRITFRNSLLVSLEHSIFDSNLQASYDQLLSEAGIVLVCSMLYRRPYGV